MLAQRINPFSIQPRLNMPLLLALLISLLLPLRPAMAFEVTVVQSGLAKPYQQVHDSFSRALARQLPHTGLKSIAPIQEKSIYLNKNDAPKDILAQLKDHKPQLIVAIGQQALGLLTSIQDIPIIALLVANPLLSDPSPPNIIIFPLSLPPGKALQDLQILMPSIKKVGVVYDPHNSQDTIDAAEKACPDLTFIKRPTNKSRFVIKETESLTNKIDLLWMVPDITTVTPLTEATYILFSIQQQVPLLAFTEQQLRRGATFAQVFDLAALGRQAAAMAIELKQGTPLSQLQLPEHTPSTLLSNDIVIRKLRLLLSDEEQP